MENFSYKTQLLQSAASSLKKKGRPVCAFTVDVEDWYQSCIDFDAPISSQVDDNVKRVLQVLNARSVKGTFFVQGMVAEKFPSLMQLLVADGHEIQSHGYSHRPLNKMNRAELKSELDRAKKSVEDACGLNVTAFRAPDFTILRDNLWALEMLAETGFKIDSSIFPLNVGRYGIDGWELGPQRVTFSSGTEIVEVPVAIYEKFGRRVPVGGGGYFRLFPYFLVAQAVRNIIANGRAPIIYCHPYEFNPSELSQYRTSSPQLFRVQQGIGRKSFAKRIDNFLSHFECGRLDEVLNTWGIL